MAVELRTFEVKAGWSDLRDRLADRLPESDLASLDEAVDFAARWHGDQRRPAGEPYVEHLLEVVSVLAEALGVTDVDMLRAAVLHDVVEDTGCTLGDVATKFGQPVATLVDWVTKPEPAEGQTSAEARAAYLLRFRDAPADALTIKLADRLSNVQRLDSHPRPEKRASYYQETLRSVVPLARSHPWFHDWYATWTSKFAYLVAEPR